MKKKSCSFVRCTLNKLFLGRICSQLTDNFWILELIRIQLNTLQPMHRYERPLQYCIKARIHLQSWTVFVEMIGGDCFLSSEPPKICKEMTFRVAIKIWLLFAEQSKKTKSTLKERNFKCIIIFFCETTKTPKSHLIVVAQIIITLNNTKKCCLCVLFKSLHNIVWNPNKSQEKNSRSLQYFIRKIFYPNKNNNKCVSLFISSGVK